MITSHQCVSSRGAPPTYTDRVRLPSPIPIAYTLGAVSPPVALSSPSPLLRSIFRRPAEAFRAARATPSAPSAKNPHDAPNATTPRLSSASSTVPTDANPHAHNALGSMNATPPLARHARSYGAMSIAWAHASHWSTAIPTVIIFPSHARATRRDVSRIVSSRSYGHHVAAVRIVVDVAGTTPTTKRMRRRRCGTSRESRQSNIFVRRRARATSRRASNDADRFTKIRFI